MIAVKMEDVYMVVQYLGLDESDGGIVGMFEDENGILENIDYGSSNLGFDETREQFFIVYTNTRYWIKRRDYLLWNPTIRKWRHAEPEEMKKQWLVDDEISELYSKSITVRFTPPIMKGEN